MLTELGWIDWALLGVLAVSVIVGLVRGFVFEVMSLAGWLVAWFGGQWLTREAAPHVPVGEPGSPVNLMVTFALCFFAVLVAWSLLARLVRMLVQATPLTVGDRLLGAGFGLLRGGVLLLALAFVVALTPVADSAAWRASHGARWLQLAMLGLKPLLPQDVARYLPA